MLSTCLICIYSCLPGKDLASSCFVCRFLVLSVFPNLTLKTSWLPSVSCCAVSLFICFSSSHPRVDHLHLAPMFRFLFCFLVFCFPSASHPEKELAPIRFLCRFITFCIQVSSSRPEKDEAPSVSCSVSLFYLFSLFLPPQNDC